MKSIEVSSRTNPLLIVHNQEEIKLYVNIPPPPPPLEKQILSILSKINSPIP